jgi:drug/metabolite transporter (DMT)-like permease
MRTLAAIALGGLTSALYALSTTLQALDARGTAAETAFRASLLARLVRRPLWLAGAAAGVVAWPLQALALSLASVAVVQPALGLGLIVLLALGTRLLHERIGVREVVAAVGIAVAVAAVGWAAPPGSADYTAAGQVAIVALVAAGALAPYALRATQSAGGLATSIAAGVAWAALGFATALIDVSFAERHWLALVAWGAAAAATGWSGLLAEMTALQRWPATRAIPVVFGLEMALPAALAPFLTLAAPEHTAAFAAALALAVACAVLLGRSRAVALTAP